MENGSRQPRPEEPAKAIASVKLSEDMVEKKGESFVLKEDHHIRIDARAYKMSKSRGNVINPDEVVAEYGADSLRLYEMFMGPLEATKPWSMRGVEGVSRFLNRVWRLVIDDRTEELKLQDASRTSSLTRRPSAFCTRRSNASPTTSTRCPSTPPSPP